MYYSTRRTPAQYINTHKPTMNTTITWRTRRPRTHRLPNHPSFEQDQIAKPALLGRYVSVVVGRRGHKGPTKVVPRLRARNCPFGLALRETLYYFIICRRYRLFNVGDTVVQVAAAEHGTRQLGFEHRLWSSPLVSEVAVIDKSWLCTRVSAF